MMLRWKRSLNPGTHGWELVQRGNTVGIAERKHGPVYAGGFWVGFGPDPNNQAFPKCVGTFETPKECRQAVWRHTVYVLTKDAALRLGLVL